MTDYDKWLGKQAESRGLSLRDAFKAGKKVMLEKVRNMLCETDAWSELANGSGAIHNILSDDLDQLLKEPTND